MAKEKFDFMQPIKDIPAFFKGFPKNLVHMWKDPIRNIPEADARKAELMPLLYLSVAVMLVGAILQVALGLDFMAILTFVGVVGIMYCAFLLFVISKGKAKFAALTCNDCNTMLDLHTPEEYAKYVTYTVESENTTYDLSHPESKDGIVPNVTVKGKSVATLSVSFVCPNCGKTKTFQYTIEPLKCEKSEKNVRVRDLQFVKANLESDMRSVLDIYQNGDRTQIPYSVQSIYHPNYENRDKFQSGSYGKVNGVSIRYHRGIGEMVEGLFIRNELNGNIK